MYTFYVILCVIILLATVIQHYANEYLLLVKKDENENVTVPNEKIRLENIMNKVWNLDKKNCMKQTHYCLNNIDCSDVCDNSMMQYVCNQQSFTCHPLSVNSTSTKLIECNKKKGFLTAISISPLTGVEYVCLNILPQYFQDDGTRQEFVCNGGELDINTTNTGLPNYKNCVCPENNIRVINLDRTDQVPRCIDKRFLKFLPSFGEI